MNAVRYAQYKDGSTIERGNEFQDFCMMKLAEIGIFFRVFTSRRYQIEIGESPDQVEVKADFRILDTGNVSIELEERVNAQARWVLSGIQKQDNARIYVQGNEQIILIFQKKRLQEIYASGRYPKREWQNIRRFFLPLDVARREAEHLYENGRWVK